MAHHRPCRDLAAARPTDSGWFGGFSEIAVKRAARLGDGFMFPGFNPKVIEQIRRLRGYLSDEGREPSSFGVQLFIAYGSGNEAEWKETLDACRHLGVTHVALNTIDAGFTTPREHVHALSVFAQFAGLAPTH